MYRRRVLLLGGAHGGATRFGRATVLACIAAVLALAAPLARADPATVGPVVQVAPGTPFPSGCQNAQAEPGTQGTSFEPTLVADPSSPSGLVTAWIQDAGLSDVSAFSSDGGSSWTRVLLPGGTRCTGGQSGGAVDPWLSVGPDGVIYLVTLAVDLQPGFPFTNPKSQVLVNRSTDGGRTWSQATPIQPEDGGDYDKPSVTADPRTSGRVYAVYTSRYGPAGASGTTSFARSDDGGKTWSQPATIDSPPQAPFPQWPHGNVITVLPDGALVDVFALANVSAFSSGTSGSPESEWAMRSQDGGTSWSAPVHIADVSSRLPADGDQADQRLVALPLPSVVQDGQGGLLVAWHDNPAADAGKILIARSADGGRSFLAPTAAAAPHGQAFLPTLAVGPNNTLGLMWYDTRHDTAGDGKLTTDVWFEHSHDWGKTWSEVHVDGPFDALKGTDFFDQGREIGDYITLLGAPAGFDAVLTEAQPRSTAPASVFATAIALGTPRLTLSVRPRRARAGHRVRLHLRVTSRPLDANGIHRPLAPVAGATIRAAGRVARTNRRGRATLRIRVTKPSSLRLRATRPGYRAASVTIRVA